MQLQEQVIQGFRLSPQQKRLWYLQQNSLAYSVQGTILLEGNLNQKVLKLALQQVIQQHEILRTPFFRHQGVKTPIQVIFDNSIPSWNEANLSYWNTQEQTAKIAAIVQEEKIKPFNFEQGSLLHANFLTLLKHKHILLLTLPALCADNQSIQNLVQQISRIYSESLADKNLGNNDKIVQYIQFSEWQNQILEDGEDIVGKEFWQQQISITTIELKLPFEFKLADSIPFAVNTLNLQIESQLLAQIVALVETNHVTVSTFFLTCWQVLLRRLTGTDVVIGVACDGRQYEELATAIGLFAKYLPLNSLQTDYRFSELLQ